jgi:glycosyltransferase involved in cell wall biosynthesis
MEFRPYYLAKEWVRRGDRVTIIAATFSHVRSVNPVKKKNEEIEEIDGIRYVWLKTPTYTSNNWLRIFNIFAFLYRLYRFIPRLLKRESFDAVIASSTYPLDIFPARRIARKTGAKLIYEVHDLWPLSPIELGGYSRRHPYIVLLQIAEDYAYKNSDKVVSLLNNAREYMIGRGMDANKFAYAPNFVCEDYLTTPSSVTVACITNILADKFIVGYLGTMGLSNYLENLVGAAEILSNNKEISFVLVGDGPERIKLEKLVASKKLQNIDFLGRVEKVRVPAVLSEFDLCYIGFLNKPIYRMGISPNKLFDYMAAAKPVILAANAGEDMVRESNCGMTIKPEDPQALATAILKLKALSEAERARMGENGRQYVLRNHTCRVVASRFLESLQH